jgi:hypothetical protein
MLAYVVGFERRDAVTLKEEDDDDAEWRWWWLLPVPNEAAEPGPKMGASTGIDSPPGSGWTAGAERLMEEDP